MQEVRGSTPLGSTNFFNDLATKNLTFSALHVAICHEQQKSFDARRWARFHMRGPNLAVRNEYLLIELIDGE